MLFDSSCPLCAREVRFLRSLRRSHLVRFTDICDPSFSATALGKPLDTLLSEMHVKDLRSGVLHTRVDAFRVLYRTLFNVDVLFFTRFWPLSAIADAAYGVIAANKHRVAGLFAEGAPADAARGGEKGRSKGEGHSG